MQVAFFCCVRQGVAGMSRDLGRDVPDLEKLYARELWADFSFPRTRVSQHWSAFVCVCSHVLTPPFVAPPSACPPLCGLWVKVTWTQNSSGHQVGQTGVSWPGICARVRGRTLRGGVLGTFWKAPSQNPFWEPFSEPFLSVKPIAGPLLRTLLRTLPQNPSQNSSQNPS